MNKTQDSKMDFKGYTLDELRYKRAQALLRLEIGKTKMSSSLAQMKERANDHGVRGFLFKNDTIKQLRAADYVMMGFKLFNWYYRFKRNRRR